LARRRFALVYYPSVETVETVETTMQHRLHVVGLPHTQTTSAFSSCAYTEKVRKFCKMMMDQGNEDEGADAEV
jgi:hypothetical protein